MPKSACRQAPSPTLLRRSQHGRGRDHRAFFTIGESPCITWRAAPISELDIVHFIDADGYTVDVQDLALAAHKPKMMRSAGLIHRIPFARSARSPTKVSALVFLHCASRGDRRSRQQPLEGAHLMTIAPTKARRAFGLVAQHLASPRSWTDRLSGMTANFGTINQRP